MYYINCFFMYSILGFITETIINWGHWESGILYGPWTFIYGLGSLTIIFLSKYLFQKLHLPRYLELPLLFILIMIILSSLEYLGGYLIEYFFHVTFWDYSSLPFHIGKYASLEMSFLWGFASLFFIYLLKPMIDKIIYKIPTFITYALIITFSADIITTLINGIKI